ncbi:MAG TPA: hypothetical protein VJ124_18360 [Pyrinomonadaceae bacterium]|nr:hypothetical protein [Pyrinomonadaceae bacterium]
MKRCPKCNRTFPDENQKFCTVDGGLLIGTQPAFDPNATIRASSEELGLHTEPGARERADSVNTSRELPDLNATVAADPSAPTAVFQRNTGAASRSTSAELAAPTIATAAPATVITPAPAVPPPPIGISPPPPTGRPQPPIPTKKRSKLPWILGGLLLLLLLGAGSVVGVFFYVVKPRLDELRERGIVVRESGPPENRNENSSASGADAAKPEPATTEENAFLPPPDAVKFTNSNSTLDGRLAEHYVGFSFYYPNTWQSDPKAGVPGASNFARVQKMFEDDTGEYLQESATFSWYTSNGTFESDASVFPERARSFSSQLAANLPGYEKLSENPTAINSLSGYEFRFQGIFEGTGKGDLPYWGRAIFVPPGKEGEKNGVVIVLMASSLASGLSGIEDVGERGELPLILESFRFNNN